MKQLILLIAVCAFSCKNKSSQIKVYMDSASYYSAQMSAITDSGYTGDIKIDGMRDTRRFIAETMRKHYIDKAEELKK